MLDTTAGFAQQLRIAGGTDTFIESLEVVAKSSNPPQLGKVYRLALEALLWGNSDEARGIFVPARCV